MLAPVVGNQSPLGRKIHLMNLSSAKDAIGKAIGAALQQLGHPAPVIAVAYVTFVVTEDREGLAYGAAIIAAGRDAPCRELAGLAAAVLLEDTGEVRRVTEVPAAGGGS